MTKFLTMVVVLVLSAALGGCHSGEDPPTRTYTPKPDTKLFNDIGEIPGVSKVDISYVDKFGTSNTYVGTVYVETGEAAAGILDHTYAILRQGSYRAAINVVALQDNKEIPARKFGLSSPTNAELTERYGPQPGNGKPPSETP